MKTMILSMKFLGEEGPYDIQASCSGFSFSNNDRFLLLFEDGDVPIGCYSTTYLTGFSISHKDNEVYRIN